MKRRSSGWQAWWREAVLLLGFLLIVVAGVFSVLLPEIADEPDTRDDATGSSEAE